MNAPKGVGICIVCMAGVPAESLERHVCRACRQLPAMAAGMRERFLASDATHVTFGPMGNVAPLTEAPSAAEVEALRRRQTAVVDLGAPNAIALMVPHLRRGIILATELAKVGLLGSSPPVADSPPVPRELLS